MSTSAVKYQSKNFERNSAVDPRSVTLEKWCCKCDATKSSTDFNLNLHRRDGLRTYCKECGRAKGKRRTSYVKQATPAWANLSSVVKVKGLCLDHVIPLVGSVSGNAKLGSEDQNVCGLNCSFNLQLITNRDNNVKQGKFDPPQYDGDRYLAEHLDKQGIPHTLRVNNG